MKVDYKILLLSIAKKKVMDAYWGRRFEFVDFKPRQLTMIEYLKKYDINNDTLYFIGEEALTDMRTSVYKKYEKGELDNIPNLEEDITKEFDTQRYMIDQQITFTKFIPRVENPSEKFLSLVSMDIPPEPLSPRQTYGGESMDEYYPPR